MERPTCESCPYWDRVDEGDEHGWCHRYPPVIDPDDPDEVISPFVVRRRWCGEHPDFPDYLEELRSAQWACSPPAGPEEPHGLTDLGELDP